MVVKKATTTKKPSVRTSAPAKKKRVSKGESLVCEVCGLAVVVEQVGDLVVSHEDVLLCCSKPMKSKAAKAKATKK